MNKFNILYEEIISGTGINEKQLSKVPKELWHISNSKFKKFSRHHSAQGIFWFAKNKENLIKNFHGAGITTQKPIWLYRCKADVKNPAGWDEYDKYGLGQLEEMGFDSIDLDDDFVVFDENDIKILEIEQVKVK